MCDDGTFLRRAPLGALVAVSAIIMNASKWEPPFLVWDGERELKFISGFFADQQDKIRFLKRFNRLEGKRCFSRYVSGGGCFAKVLIPRDKKIC